MATPGQPPPDQPRAEQPGGLTATELAAACGELLSLAGATVLDVAPLRVPPGADDLLLVLQGPAAKTKGFLHVAPGGRRARVTLTAARLPADAFARGVARDLLQKELAGARLQHVAATPGERRCALTFAGERGERRLIVELFGARGLWALLDAEGRVLVASRLVETAVRVLRPGDVYAPPPAGGRKGDGSDGAPRFPPPVLPAIDAFYRQHDEHADAVAEHELLARAADGALRKARARVQGLAAQLADVGRAAALREQADLMLAYAHTVPRGAPSMRVPDPRRDGEELTIELDPSKPVIAQGQALYDKARRLDDGRAISERRLAEAEAVVKALQPVAAALAQLPADSPELTAQKAALRAVLQAHGALPRASGEPSTKAPARDDTGGENVRRFVSAEGYPILVGRNNEQNDRLTMRIANGNDLWLHVGGGRAGSHVVVRLPKQKTASLETLLDAGTLAVHFSKARGQHRIDVVYTQRKHVKKPKGLPAGAVVPSQTKTITVVLDEARLARLLGSMPEQ